MNLSLLIYILEFVFLSLAIPPKVHFNIIM